MKNLVRVLFALLFMVSINACTDGFADAQEDMIINPTETEGSPGHTEGPE